MATVNLTDIVLLDRWPGVPNANLGIPTGGWDNTTDNYNSADDTAKAWSTPWPVGTKIQMYTDNSAQPGYYTMMYLAHHAFSAACTVDAEDISNGIAYCFHYDASDAVAYDAADSSVCPYYIVSNCYTVVHIDMTTGQPVAIPCATIDYGSTVSSYTNGYGDSFGWFWVGGVCPCKDATLLQGTGSAITGCEVTCDAAGTSLGNGSGPFWIEFTAGTGLVTMCDSSTYNDSTSLYMPQAIGLLCTSQA